jgi:hypothetical protein
MAASLSETARGVSGVIVKSRTGHTRRGEVSPDNKNKAGYFWENRAREKENPCDNNTIQTRISKSTINCKQSGELCKYLSVFIRIQVNDWQA